MFDTQSFITIVVYLQGVLIGCVIGTMLANRRHGEHYRNWCELFDRQSKLQDEMLRTIADQDQELTELRNRHV